MYNDLNDLAVMSLEESARRYPKYVFTKAIDAYNFLINSGYWKDDTGLIRRDNMVINFYYVYDTLCVSVMNHSWSCIFYSNAFCQIAELLIEPELTPEKIELTKERLQLERLLEKL